MTTPVSFGDVLLTSQKKPSNKQANYIVKLTSPEKEEYADALGGADTITFKISQNGKGPHAEVELPMDAYRTISSSGDGMARLEAMHWVALRIAGKIQELPAKVKRSVLNALSGTLNDKTNQQAARQWIREQF